MIPRRPTRPGCPCPASAKSPIDPLSPAAHRRDLRDPLFASPRGRRPKPSSPGLRSSPFSTWKTTAATNAGGSGTRLLPEIWFSKVGNSGRSRCAKNSLFCDLYLPGLSAVTSEFSPVTSAHFCLAGRWRRVFVTAACTPATTMAKRIFTETPLRLSSASICARCIPHIACAPHAGREIPSNV
jgi:hypothetical protein